jgi:hypothetical protein
MGRPLGSKNKKSVWLLQSLAQNGYDYEKLLVKFLNGAAQGNQRYYAMAQLLVKMVPYLANMPKTDTGVLQIETLVINRLESKPTQSVDTEAIPTEEGHPPLVTDGLNAPSQSEAK